MEGAGEGAIVQGVKWGEGWHGVYCYEPPLHPGKRGGGQGGSAAFLWLRTAAPPRRAGWGEVRGAASCLVTNRRSTPTSGVGRESAAESCAVIWYSNTLFHRPADGAGVFGWVSTGLNSLPKA